MAENLLDGPPNAKRAKLNSPGFSAPDPTGEQGPRGLSNAGPRGARRLAGLASGFVGGWLGLGRPREARCGPSGAGIVFRAGGHAEVQLEGSRGSSGAPGPPDVERRPPAWT